MSVCSLKLHKVGSFLATWLVDLDLGGAVDTLLLHTWVQNAETSHGHSKTTFQIIKKIDRFIILPIDRVMKLSIGCLCRHLEKE